MDTSVFRWGTSLGKGVARTYEQLHHHGHPASLEQLVDLTTMHRTTVTRHLDRLHDEGLVEKTHDGWNVTPNPDWDAIGERTGAAQAARKQHARHVADRAQLQQRLSAPDLGHVRRGRVVEPDTCRVARDLDEVAEAPGLLGVEQQRQKRRAEKLVAVTRKPVNTPMRGPRKVGSGGDLGRAVRNHDEQRTAELDAAYEEAGELRIEKKPRGGAALHIVQTSAKKVEVDKCATKLIVNQNLTGVNGDGSVEQTGP